MGLQMLWKCFGEGYDLMAGILINLLANIYGKLLVIIDREAGEIIRLVASVCLWVCVCVCLFKTSYSVHLKEH